MKENHKNKPSQSPSQKQENPEKKRNSIWESRFYFNEKAWLPIYSDNRETAIENIKNWHLFGREVFEADELNKEMIIVPKNNVWFVTVFENKEELSEPITP